MCNFMGVRVSKMQFIKLKQLEKELGTLAALDELQLMKNGFAYSNSLIVRRAADNNDIEAVMAHWEFIPHWVKDMEEVKAARKKVPWLNAKSETILSSKMFRPAALKRRCLVVLSHFYEWRHYQPEGEKKPIAYPYSIGVNDHDYFYAAGIWQPWTDKSTGETMDTFAIITTEANELMAEIHNTKKRMPTILTEDLAYEWIMKDLSEDRIQQIASYQIPSEYMYAYTIKKDFKTLEDPCEEHEYEELPALDIAL